MPPEKHPPIARKYIHPLTANVLTVDSAALSGATPSLILEGHRFDLFRNNGQFATFIAKPPGQLSAEDIGAIDTACDTQEGGRNKSVKNTLARALARYFNRQSFHMTEIGAGKHPLAGYIADPAFSWHGVVLDDDTRDYIQTKLHMPASKWSDIPPMPGDKPAIAASVYALHFMVKRDFPKLVDPLIGKDGFFVGNMYLDPMELRERRQTKFFETVLRNARMDFVRIADPACKSNEYWIIAKAGQPAAMRDFATVLGDTLRQQTRQPAPAPAHTMH